MSPLLPKKDNRRSYRNLLLAKGYQLSFTLLMVVLTAGIMFWLGRQVDDMASRATLVAENNIVYPCPELPTSGDAEDVEPAPAAKDAETVTVEPSRPRARPVVTIEGEIRNDVVAPAPIDVAAVQKARDACLNEQSQQMARVRARKKKITIALWAFGGLLLVGLMLYGVKMTHRVAGPLHKVQLYMAKVRDGRYDTVYNLRKGDDLIAFYKHFKDAHDGLKSLQQEDRDRLVDLLALVREEGLAERAPDLRESVATLEKMLAEREESLA